MYNILIKSTLQVIIETKVANTSEQREKRKSIREVRD